LAWHSVAAHCTIKYQGKYRGNDGGQGK
jgi:hypothetical protein